MTDQHNPILDPSIHPRSDEPYNPEGLAYPNPAAPTFGPSGDGGIRESNNPFVGGMPDLVRGQVVPTANVRNIQQANNQYKQVAD